MKQKVPGFKVIYDYENRKGAPTIRIGKYIVDNDLDINIDGRPLPLSVDPPWLLESLKDALASYQLGNFTGLEVIYSSKYKVQTVNGVAGYRGYYYAKIEITTLNGKGWYTPVNTDVVYYRPLPVMKPKNFYSPKYTINDALSSKKDNRATIVWLPDVVTDSEGRGSVSFYTSDIPGRYSISLEGSDMKGAFGSSRNKIIVKGESGNK